MILVLRFRNREDKILGKSLLPYGQGSNVTTIIRIPEGTTTITVDEEHELGLPVVFPSNFNPEPGA